MDRDGQLKQRSIIEKEIDNRNRDQQLKWRSTIEMEIETEIDN